MMYDRSNNNRNEQQYESHHAPRGERRAARARASTGARASALGLWQPTSAKRVALEQPRAVEAPGPSPGVQGALEPAAPSERTLEPAPALPLRVPEPPRIRFVHISEKKKLSKPRERERERGRRAYGGGGGKLRGKKARKKARKKAQSDCKDSWCEQMGTRDEHERCAAGSASTVPRTK